MFGIRNESQRNAASFTISLILHAALVFLLPGIGTSPSSTLLGKGGAVSVTLVNANPVSTIKSNTGNPAPAVKTNTQTKPVAKQAKPAAPTPQVSASKPAAKPATVATPPKTTARQDTTAGRVLTSSQGEDSRAPAADPNPQPVGTASSSTSQSQPAPEPEPPAPPPVPSAGSVVGGFGLTPRLSGKETEGLTDVVQLVMAVTVPPAGSVKAVATSPSSNSRINYLERLAAFWIQSERYMEFQRLSNTYQVNVEVVIDPGKTNPVFRLAKPNEQVRIVQP